MSTSELLYNADENSFGCPEYDIEDETWKLLQQIDNTDELTYTDEHLAYI